MGSRVARWVVAAAVTLAVVLALTVPTSRERVALSCAPLPEPCEALADAERVFYGEVLGTNVRPRFANGNAEEDAANEVRFNVLRLLKGDRVPESGEWSGAFHETAWAHHFKDGERVLVYARRTFRGLWHTACGRTRAFGAEDSGALAEELLQLEACRRGASRSEATHVRPIR